MSISVTNYDNSENYNLAEQRDVQIVLDMLGDIQQGLAYVLEVTDSYVQMGNYSEWVAAGKPKNLL